MKKGKTDKDREPRINCFNTALAGCAQPEIVCGEIGEPFDPAFLPF